MPLLLLFLLLLFLLLLLVVHHFSTRKSIYASFLSIQLPFGRFA
jgi:hypothetical protein